MIFQANNKLFKINSENQKIYPFYSEKVLVILTPDKFQKISNENWN